MADDNDPKVRDGAPDRSAGTAGEAVDADYVRATTPVRTRLAWQVLIWPVAMILLVILGAFWALS